MRAAFICTGRGVIAACLFVFNVALAHGLDFDEYKQNSTYDVIVIGAGASGVAALTRLHQAGLTVLGLEAEDRIGGRVNTQFFGTGPVEFGAEWVHGRVGNVVYELAEESMIVVPQRDDMQYTYYNSNGTAMPCNRQCMMTLGYMLQVVDNITTEPVEVFEQYVDERYDAFVKSSPDLQNQREYLDSLVQWYKKLGYTLDGSGNWTKMSNKGWAESVNLEGPKDQTWGSWGYKTLFNIMLNKTSKNPAGLPIDIKLMKEVVQVNWIPEDRAGHVSVECSDGSVYWASTIIITVSLGVLQDSYDGLFQPPLPEWKEDAINILDMGKVHKMVLRYKSEWWEGKTDLAFVWSEKDIDSLPSEDKWLGQVFGATIPAGSDNVITLWLVGELVEEAERIPIGVMKKKLDWLVARFCKNHFPTLVDSVQLRRTKWCTDSHFRGTYSFHGLRSDSLDDPTEGLRAELENPGTGAPALLFAGEATSRSQFGTVHGAVETGWREADRVIKWRKEN